jgi:CheY-like chemotaxis protein
MTKILVIEDNNDLREDVVEMLELEGYETYGAENGIEGVEKARQKIPDLILCDIMMPKMDGYEVLEALRAVPDTAVIPFIFLTAKTERIDMRQGMVLGADDYLMKPFDVDELLNSISAQLQKRAELNEVVNRRMKQLRENIVTALPHELRTSLNTIIGYSDILQAEAHSLRPDQIVSWSGYIHKAAYRLYRMVENYLYYVRLQMMIQKGEPINIEEPVGNIAPIIEVEARRIAESYKRADDLVLEVESSVTLNLNYVDIVKIIHELLDNSFKFSQKGQRVQIKGYIEDNIYAVCFLDEGIGISAEQAQNIGAYMQFDRWLHEQQGMGLGLAVVKLFAQFYDAEFSIEGVPDQGSKVCIRFKQV